MIKKKKKNNRNPLLISRFAPCPSFYPHIGHLRGLLFLMKKLSSKTKNFKIYLRFDDTDKKNFKKEYYRNFIKLFTKYNVPCAGIIRASERLKKYLMGVKKLLKRNYCYVCSCKNTESQPYRSNCNCKILNRNTLQEFKPGTVIRFHSKNESDYVILRYCDNLIKPTLVLQSVIDDLDLGINYWIRGRDLESSEKRYDEVYTTLCGAKRKKSQSEYWGLLKVTDSKTGINYELSKSLGANPNQIPGLFAIQKIATPEKIKKFLGDYGYTKNNITIDMQRLYSYMKVKT